MYNVQCTSLLPKMEGRHLSSVGFFPKWLKWPGWGVYRAGTPSRLSVGWCDPNTWAIYCCLPSYISRKLDGWGAGQHSCRCSVTSRDSTYWTTPPISSLHHCDRCLPCEFTSWELWQLIRSAAYEYSCGRTSLTSTTLLIFSGGSAKPSTKLANPKNRLLKTSQRKT